MNEELRIQRVKQYGSFLYCPRRDRLCFGRYTDEECQYDSCILDDPEYQRLQQKIAENQEKRRTARKETPAQFVPPSRPASRSAESDAWKEVHAIEAKAAKLYRKNKPKAADGLMATALRMRRRLMNG